LFFRVFCRKYPQIPPCVGTSTLGKSWSIFQKDESYSISKDSILCYGVRMIFVDGKCLVYPYPLSRQKLGVFKVDSSPCVKAVGTEGARRATGVPTAAPYTSAGVR